LGGELKEGNRKILLTRRKGQRKLFKNENNCFFVYCLWFKVKSKETERDRGICRERLAEVELFGKKSREEFPVTKVFEKYRDTD